MVKRTILSIMPIILFFVIGNTFGSEYIRFGVSATYPPFEFLNINNQIVGFDIDIAKELCNNLQKKCIFTNYTFNSLIPSLKFKKCDAAISGIEITHDRSKQISFTEPYYVNSASIIAKKKTSFIF